MVALSVETPADRAEVETLYDLAFAPGRSALSSYQLRRGRGPVAPLCLVARDEAAQVMGAIRYWAVRVVGDRRWSALLLGPVAVHPIRQGEGLGAQLILDSMARAEALGWRRALLVGDAPYYARFGFSRAAAEGLMFPPPTNPNRVLARALAPGALDGVAGRVCAWTPEDGPEAPQPDPADA